MRDRRRVGQQREDRDIAGDGRPRVSRKPRTIACECVVLATDATARLTKPIRGRTGSSPWCSRPCRSMTISPRKSAGAIAGRSIDLPLLWGRAMPSGGLMLGRELIDVSADPTTLQSAIMGAADKLTMRLHGLHPALGSLGVRGVLGRSDCARPPRRPLDRFPYPVSRTPGSWEAMVATGLRRHSAWVRSWRRRLSFNGRVDDDRPGAVIRGMAWLHGNPFRGRTSRSD